MSYKHGVYGVNAETYEATSVAQGTVPVYIGTAPVHRINKTGESGFDYSPYVNKPILISSLREVKEMGLYSDDWETYSLCEAIHAHFMNGDEAVAPIILINLATPKGDVANASVTFVRQGNKCIGYLEDPKALIDEFAMEAEGVTNVTYSYNGDVVVIECDAEGDEYDNGFSVPVTYEQISNGMLDIDNTTFEKAIESLDYCEQSIGLIPNIIVAPKISTISGINDLLVQKAMNKIAGKWGCVVLSDIDTSMIKTYDSAKTAKKGSYGSKYCKPYWGLFGYGDKVYHGSTIGAYMMQKYDTANNGVPYVSTSNKEVFCDRVIVGDNETLMISEQKANELNQVGITTANIINRTLRLWGAHMGNYDHAKIGNIAPEDRFDTTVRMSIFILNYLQNQYINEIDESFTRKDIDSIVNSIQTWLDSLVNDGVLLYATVSFNNESNSDTDIANGDFVFDLNVTYGVIAKSITFKLQYTNTGIALLTTGGDE